MKTHVIVALLISLTTFLEFNIIVQEFSGL